MLTVCSKAVHLRLRPPRSIPLTSLYLGALFQSKTIVPSRRWINTSPMPAQRRLDEISKAFSLFLPPVGTLKLGDITYTVPAQLSPSRLARSRSRSGGFKEQEQFLDVGDPINLEHLHFLLQKYVLGQDVFLVSQPGPYARRLVMTFASIINAEYEYVALHRDVGEAELKQGREIRAGGNLVYVDSPAVCAVKNGRILVLEGIEKAERGIMPVLNNLLENREMNLDDGTHIIHPHRYAQLEQSHDFGKENIFIPAHKNFRVIAIAAPVPPYPGYPLDPPFRSRFQARFIDPLSSSVALSNQASISPSDHLQTINDVPALTFLQKIREIILTTQYASESRHALEAVSKFALPPFPQTALLKLTQIISTFPPPAQLNPGLLARLFTTLHPGLLHAPFQAWALLSSRTKEVGLGELASPFQHDSSQSVGLLGYRVVNIERKDGHSAVVFFEGQAGTPAVSVTVPAGPKRLRPFPLTRDADFKPTERFMDLLTSVLQAHSLGWDIFILPPVLPSAASSSTSTLIKVFGQVLGYENDTVHLYKEIGGRELVMRRKIQEEGATTWEASPLISAAWTGKLLHLAGIDVIGSTAGSLSRLMQDREIELWEGKRLVSEASVEELSSGELSVASPTFRIFATASKSLPLKDWLSYEHSNMFFAIPSQPMDTVEETEVLLETGCLRETVNTLLMFAEKYRRNISSENTQKSRKLGTRSLVRIAKRSARFQSDTDLHAVISRSLLAEFLPASEQMSLDNLLDESGIKKRVMQFYPPLIVKNNNVIFPPATSTEGVSESIAIPLFKPDDDPTGIHLVPHMDSFYDNSLQTGLMRDLAIDLEILHEHLVLLGNQGVGKNKIVDRLCQLLGRPREYIQLHRDTTVNQLMFTTTLEGGFIRQSDSPLLRAIVNGRVIIIDEADKAAEHVCAIFRSLAGHNEMTLPDGRRVCATPERKGDICVHPNFRLVLLANRPGYPFLGNHFLQVLGDNFSCHSISNPDQDSERKLLTQLAPELDEDILRKLVAVFQELRREYDNGTLSYPYSLRELINLVRHMRAYPRDSLGTSLRNVFDFDIYKPETIDKLAAILERHGLVVQSLGLDAAREAVKGNILDLQFDPASTELDQPKEGKHDPDNEPHEGGNTWAAGSGGRNTAGLGGIGGYKRLYKGHDIKQVSDEVKDQVPADIKEKAREMAREELQRRLEELDMSTGEATGYGELLKAVQSHMLSLHDLLEHLAAKEKERVWIKRQTDGELDDSRLTEGLTGEATVYKRRGMEEPELGRPQIKPKRIRFIFDISASMYRFQYDGRLQRSLETAVMLMETFSRLSRKDKYVWDMYGHSGDSHLIPLIEADKPPIELRDRWKVIEKMVMTTQYTFAGDYTLDAIEKGVTEVGKFDGDDWGVIAITDANFGRYQITAEELDRAMSRDPKVFAALICIGEGAEAPWITQRFPGRAFRVGNTADIPRVLKSILSTMVER